VNSHKKLLVLAFLKCGLPFCDLNTTGDMINFLFRFRQFWFNLLKLKTKRNSQYLTAQKRQTTFWKIPGLGEFCDYCFKNHTC